MRRLRLLSSGLQRDDLVFIAATKLNCVHMRSPCLILQGSVPFRIDLQELGAAAARAADLADARERCRGGAAGKHPRAACTRRVRRELRLR